MEKKLPIGISGEKPPLGVKIRLLKPMVGMGGVGDLAVVGQERSDRWCREGIAELAVKPKSPPEEAKDPKQKE